MALSPKQSKLYESLRQMERDGDRMPRAEFVTRLVRETGYKEVSTYLSKYLDRVVVKGADDALSVRGVLAMSEDEFASLLTQKRLAQETHVPRYESQEEWADLLRTLLDYGSQRGYVLDAEGAELVRSVLPGADKASQPS
jgi:hypothetical protein